MSDQEKSVILTQNTMAMRWRAFQRSFGLGLNAAFELPPEKPEDQLVDLLRMADARRADEPPKE